MSSSGNGTVRFTPECQRLLDLLEITAAQATAAIHRPHRELRNAAGTRLIALGWPERGPMILVDSRVTGDGDPDVTADLVLALRPELPAGQVTREMELDGQIMPLVAASFGRRVRPHATFPGQFWYRGPWDGGTPTVERFPREPRGKLLEIAVTGSFSFSDKSCEMVWAFDLERYREWFIGG